MQNSGVSLWDEIIDIESEEFARLTACTFLSEGIRVYYIKDLVHTPMVVSPGLRQVACWDLDCREPFLAVCHN